MLHAGELAGWGSQVLEKPVIGSTIFADGMLYLYNEKGQVGLYNPNGPKMEQVSAFKVTKGTKAHYAHPVICGGVMYIRHGKALLAYQVEAVAGATTTSEPELPAPAVQETVKLTPPTSLMDRPVATSGSV